MSGGFDLTLESEGSVSISAPGIVEQSNGRGRTITVLRDEQSAKHEVVVESFQDSDYVAVWVPKTMLPGKLTFRKMDVSEVSDTLGRTSSRLNKMRRKPDSIARFNSDLSSVSSGSTLVVREEYYHGKRCKLTRNSPITIPVEVVTEPPTSPAEGDMPESPAKPLMGVEYKDVPVVQPPPPPRIVEQLPQVSEQVITIVPVSDDDSDDEVPLTPIKASATISLGSTIHSTWTPTVVDL
jgi:hypothetical protein